MGVTIQGLRGFYPDARPIAQGSVGSLGATNPWKDCARLPSAHDAASTAMEQAWRAQSLRETHDAFAFAV